MSNFNEEICEFKENSQIENFGTNPSCNKNPQALLGNQTCNYWSWKDEKTVQSVQMPNYQTTGTVAPGWDCWYEKTQQCVSEKCLDSEDPIIDCHKRNNWPPPPVYNPPGECIIC